MTRKEPRIKIFVAHHKPWYIYEDDVYVPIQVWKKNAKVDLWILWDDTWDNISEKNDNYAELTAQYWVWKNYDLRDVDYVWFCHYRRYMTYCYRPNLFNYIFAKDFYSPIEQKGGWLRWKIISYKEHNCLFKYKEDILKHNSLGIRKEIAKGWIDVYMPKKNILYSKIIKHFFWKNIIGDCFWDFYEKNILENKCEELFIKMYPEQKKILGIVEKDGKYKQWFRKHLFIMRKELFLDYVKRLFDYLFELERKIKKENIKISLHWAIARWDSRFMGIFAESLINYRLEYQKEKNNIRISDRANTLVFTDYYL